MNSNKLWEQEEFEDLVNKSMIAMYETKFKPVKHEAKPSRLTLKSIEAVKRKGCIFLPNDRLLQLSMDENERPIPIQNYDILNNGRPDNAMMSMLPVAEAIATFPDVYLSITYIERVGKIPKGVRAFGDGKLYKVTFLHMTDSGIKGNADYCRISSSGDITAAEICNGNWGRNRFHAVDIWDTDPIKKTTTTVSASMCIQMHSDLKHLWNVEASDGKAKATFGIYEEQLKSLFYARNLPATSAGRKRPILHWVSAHRRRMQNGTDIDVMKHMRGVTSFVMDGTKFDITNPLK
ncbi:MAG: hypothetical protein QNK36_15165 [Colwellia sp.]|nr:hypothetical protein [Colwellia sp.]